MTLSPGSAAGSAPSRTPLPSGLGNPPPLFFPFPLLPPDRPSSTPGGRSSPCPLTEPSRSPPGHAAVPGAAGGLQPHGGAGGSQAPGTAPSGAAVRNTASGDEAVGTGRAGGKPEGWENPASSSQPAPKQRGVEQEDGGWPRDRDAGTARGIAPGGLPGPSLCSWCLAWARADPQAAEPKHPGEAAGRSSAPQQGASPWGALSTRSGGRISSLPIPGAVAPTQGHLGCVGYAKGDGEEKGGVGPVANERQCRRALDLQGRSPNPLTPP